MVQDPARRRGRGVAPLKVLFCGNPPYFQHMATAAVSLAENTPAAIEIHVLTCDHDPNAEGMLRESLRGYECVSVRVHQVDDSRLRGLFVDKFMTKECYLRILAPEILSSEAGRILYLDCDLVVRDDLRPLWNAELGDNVIAAAPDYPRVPELITADRLTSLGIPADGLYVNSGVLLIDLDRWRSEGLTARLMRYIEETGSALSLYDQDAINAVLCGRIRILDCRWNLQARMYRVGRPEFPMEVDATREARRNPAIIHYTGSEKPWLFRSRTACKREYFRYLRKTAWRDAKPATKSIAQRAEYGLDRMLSKAGIDYLQVLYVAGRIPAKLKAFTSTLAQRSGRDPSAPGAQHP